MSWHLHLWALTFAGITTALACGVARPGPGERPGRDGDPISAIAPLPPWMLEGGGGGCRSMLQSTEVDPDPTSSSRLHYSLPDSLVGGFRQVALAPWGDDAKRFVIADRGRGVRVLDATNPKELRVTASTPLPERPLALRVIGDHALLIVATRHGHELWWLALSATDAPAVIAQQTQVGELRGAHSLPALRAKGKPARVALLVDFQPEGPCGMQQRSLIRIVELSAERIAVMRAFELGENGEVQRVMRSGDWLAVHDHRRSEQSSERTSSIRFFDLSEEAIAPSDPFAVQRNVHAFHADGRTLSVVSWDGEQTDPPDQASLRLRYAVDRLRVPRTGTYRREQACTFVVQAPPPAQSWPVADPPRLTGAVFLPDRTLIPFHSTDAANSDVRVVDHRTCELLTTSVPGARFMLSPRGDVLVSFAPMDGPTLDVYVHDPKRLGTPSASAHVALDKPAIRADSVHRSTNAFWTHDVRWHALGKQLLLTVPYQEYGADGAFTQGGRVFEIEQGAVRVRDTRGLPWLMSARGTTAAVHESGLVLGDGPVHDLWTNHIDAQLLNDHRMPGVPRAIARVRYPGARPTYDRHTDALRAELEVVAGDRDPQTGVASASFEISAHAALDTVGALLVVTSQETARSENTPARHCRIEIFDVTKAAAAKKVATLVETTLCNEGRALSDQPAFSTPHALVFARHEHHYATPTEVTASRLAFNTLDLREPAQPVIRGPFGTPEGEYVLRAFGDGVRMVYGFRVALSAANQAQPVGRFYIRFVDFSDPTAPSFGEPIATRGELIGWNGDMLYVREAQWRGETAEYTVHRFVLQGDGVVQHAESGIEERSVYDFNRVSGVEAEDRIADWSGDEILLIGHGVVRRIPRAALPLE